MELKVISSGSQGNAYLLENKEEALLIECGVNIQDIKKALDFKLHKILGCIVTHEHLDHCKSAKELMNLGVDVWATEGTHDAIGNIVHHRALILRYDKTQKIGSFNVLPFQVNHDAKQPCGFLINHKETGNVLFLTDTIYSHYTFSNLNNIIIEANYSQDIARKKLGGKEFLRNRIINNHMSLDTCLKTLKANDLSLVNNIVLIHLSDSNSNEAEFKEKVQKVTGKKVYVAQNGLSVNFNKTPF